MTSPKDDAERQKAGAAHLRIEPWSEREAERQHRRVDAEHEAAPARRRRTLIQNSERMNNTVSETCRMARSGNHIQNDEAK